jgi:hypothetical protein
MFKLQSVNNLVVFGTVVGLEMIANGCCNDVHVLVRVPLTIVMSVQRRKKNTVL